MDEDGIDDIEGRLSDLEGQIDDLVSRIEDLEQFQKRIVEAGTERDAQPRKRRGRKPQ